MPAARILLSLTTVGLLLLSACGKSETSTAPSTGFTDPRDGNTYDLVKIGTQTWFGENLDYKGTGSDTVGVCSQYQVDNCDLYGRLYTWAQAMGVASSYNNTALNHTGRIQGVCPTGSHLPSDSEWVVLDSVVHGKAQRLESQLWNGNDTTGFGALPGGSRQYTGGFAVLGKEAYFWTSTEYSQADYGTYRYILNTDSLLRVASYYKTSSLSVRCLLN